MITVDYHSHTLFSNCGLHTVLEMLTWAREIGVQGLAISDHGPELKGRLNSIFFERLKDPVKGIRLLKGFECNLAGKKGKIDFIMKFMAYMDVILLGIHHNTEKGLGEKVYTRMLIEAMKKNQYIDILSHPNDFTFPIDFYPVAEAAKEMGMVLELNNSKTLHAKTPDTKTEEMLEACMDVKCPIAVCSDAHTIHEIGRDDAVRPILKRINFPESLIVNSDTEKGFNFIEKCRKKKERFI